VIGHPSMKSEISPKLSPRKDPSIPQASEAITDQILAYVGHSAGSPKEINELAQKELEQSRVPDQTPLIAAPDIPQLSAGDLNCREKEIPPEKS
jgi:hypothetical protein